MDTIQRLYRSQFVLYRGGPPVWGRWYWCLPGAGWLPGPHPWVSSRGDPADQWYTDLPLGEQRSTDELDRPRSANPYWIGTNWCGSEAALRGEATVADVGTPAVDANGVPECCDAPEWWGGSQVGGESSWSFAGPLEQGGLALGGAVS